MTDDPEEYDAPTDAEEQVAAFEEQLQDLSDKQILIGMLAELKWLRVALTQGSTPEEPDAYECLTCGKRVPEADRERHAVEQHNAHPEAFDAELEYEVVGE